MRKNKNFSNPCSYKLFKEGKKLIFDIEESKFDEDYYMTPAEYQMMFNFFIYGELLLPTPTGKDDYEPVKLTPEEIQILKEHDEFMKRNKLGEVWDYEKYRKRREEMIKNDTTGRVWK